VKERATQSATRAHPGLWGAIAGLLGSLCCLGPSAALLIGLGASSSLAGLALERSLALGLGLAMLGLGLLHSYRQSRSCSTAAGRWRSPAFLLGAFAISYALLAYGLPLAAASSAASIPPAASKESGSALSRLSLSLEKMDCPPCVVRAEQLLSAQPAVSAFVVQEGLDIVTIDYDPTRTSPDQLAALFPTNYRAVIVSDTELP
jgi:hypothetical protein